MTTITGALRYFGRIKNGTTPSSSEAKYWNGDVLWATPEDLGKLVGDKISDTKRKVTQAAVEETNLSMLPEGSVLISTRAPIGHMAINDEPMAFNQGCRGIIPGNKVIGQYLYYLLKFRAPELNAIANGTTFVELPKDELAAVQINLPPLDTQRRIAGFLDEQTARIDSLIAKKRELLERLSEKRQALITQAVTKGLNPDAPMKPSGIDWLGDIPTHWEVVNLNRLVSMKSGDMISPKDIDEDSRFPVYGGNGLRGFTDTFNTPAHTVLVGRQGAHCGNIQVTTSLTFVTEHALRCSPKMELNHEWLAAVLEVMRLGDHSVSAAQPGLSVDRLNMLRIVYTSIDEQTKIADTISRSQKLRSKTVTQIHKSITLLTEYRSALITAAVTGQIAELQ